MFTRETAFVLTLSFLTVIASSTTGQPVQTAMADQPEQKVVIVTGARFSYKLLEKWIDGYNRVNPEIRIVVESRGLADPSGYDIMAEVYNPEEDIKKDHEYLNVGRYAILPVANSESSFAHIFADKGFNTDLIKQVFFRDIFSDKEKEKPIETPFNVYTRLQKAGVPRVFAEYFGYQQKDLAGTAIAGADAHLLEAVLRDSLGVTYLPLSLIYDEHTRKPVQGLTVIPVDLNGNRKISEDEKFYDNLDLVLERLETEEPGKIKNIPVEYLHLSIHRQHADALAIDFLKWVNEHGQDDLHTFGYLKPEAKRFQKEIFNEFASQLGR